MIKIFGLFVLILLTGCSGYRDYMEEADREQELKTRLAPLGLSNMPGQPVTHLLNAFGQPETTQTLPNGDINHVWKKETRANVNNLDDHLPETQLQMKRAQRMQDREDNNLGDSASAFVLEKYQADTRADVDNDEDPIVYTCRLGVNIRNGVVAEVGTSHTIGTPIAGGGSAVFQTSQDGHGCNKFDEDWLEYQSDHPNLIPEISVNPALRPSPESRKELPYYGQKK